MVKIYTTPGCGHCGRLKIQLERAGIEFQEVDVEADPIAAQYVMFRSGGRTAVPAVELPGGVMLSNPTIVQVRQRLRVAG